MRTKPLIRRLTLIAGCVAGLGLPACVGGADAAADYQPGQALKLESVDGQVHATIVADGGRFALGVNSMTVRLEPASGASVVSAGAFMPAHGHGTSTPRVAETDEGYRVDDLNLYMPGRWSIGIDVQVGDAQDQLEFTADVQ